jgi:hypothetical protein
MDITKRQLIDLWDEIDGAKWLAEGPGNCYCPSLDAFPELHAAASPYNLIFTWYEVKLGRETWRYVTALGHVIVPPFQVADGA